MCVHSCVCVFVVFDLMFAAISGDICNSIRNANGNRESAALDSDCEQRRGVYGKGARGGRVCAWFINYRQRAKVADIEREREGERGRMGKRRREGASQRSSSHKSKWRFATFKDTLKWSVAVCGYGAYVCGVCGVCTWHLICRTRVA